MVITLVYCMQIFQMQPDVGIVSQVITFFKDPENQDGQKQKVGMPAVCGAYSPKIRSAGV